MNEITLSTQHIEDRIFTVKGLQVMLDSHLAELYSVDTKVLNQAVKRNIERFPSSFRFRLSENEWGNLRSQFVTLNGTGLSMSQDETIKNQRGKHRKYLPYVFTEQGVSMLSAVLHSEHAIKVSITIMNAFVEMRKMILNHAALLQRIDRIELNQTIADRKLENIFKALESKNEKPEKGIFFSGQVFDSYVFISDVIKSANIEIVLIDNYIDETILSLLDKRKDNVSAIIYTPRISKTLKLDIEKHNQQYPKIEIRKFVKSHDRFLIIDNETVYHIGASLKDLGKKWFAFSKINLDAGDLIKRLNE